MNRFRVPARTARRVGAVAVAVAALALGGCTASTNSVDQTAGTEFRFTDATAKGEVIPVADRVKPGAVGGDLLGGTGTYSLISDAGKVVVLNLWGSWCGPCKVETPQYQQVYLDTEADGVDFVGFAVKDVESETQNFITDNDITYPIVFDPPAKVALQLGDLPIQAGMPQTVLIDKQGRVAAAYVGYTKPSELKPAIASLVAES